MENQVDPQASGEQPEVRDEKVVEEKKDMVAYDTHRKLLAEKKKLQQELSDFRQAELQKQEALEAEQGKFKELYESYKQKTDELAAQLQGEQEGRQNFVKVQNFLNAVDGKIDSKYYDFIPTKEIHIDPDTGKVDQMSLDKAVEAFAKEHGVLIQKPNAVGTRDRAPSHAVPERKVSEMSKVELANSWGDLLNNLKK